MSQGEYYRSHDDRLDTIIGGDTSHFRRLKLCKDEYDQLAHAVEVGVAFLTFNDYIQEYYGIRLSVADSGEAFGLDYVVLDEQRYVMFVLKFGT
jgi:hypothetical protein